MRGARVPGRRAHGADRVLRRDVPAVSGRSCGCPEDYHLADCPIRVSDTSTDPGDLADAWYGDW